VNWAEGELTGVGELQLYRQAWIPDGEVRAVVVIAHGVSEHSGRYHHVAAPLAAEGYAVHALDHRGHGRSEGDRAFVQRLGNVIADLQSLIEATRATHEGVPVFLLGHSMGGLVACHHALTHQQSLSGLILSGPLAALEAASPLRRWAARMLSALTPRMGVIGIDSALISRDPEVVKAYREDPLVFHGKLPARTVSELEQGISALPRRVQAITVPTLIMYGSRDGLCPPAGSIMVHERIGARDKTMRVFDGLYHEIFNEPEQEQVIRALRAWLREHPG
jgi:acylglycerol lipase